jgi:thymidylate kinase
MDIRILHVYLKIHQSDVVSFYIVCDKYLVSKIQHQSMLF